MCSLSDINARILASRTALIAALASRADDDSLITALKNLSDTDFKVVTAFANIVIGETVEAREVIDNLVETRKALGSLVGGSAFNTALENGFTGKTPIQVVNTAFEAVDDYLNEEWLASMEAFLRG